MPSANRPALRLYAGPAARRHIEQHGLLPAHVGAVPGAAGGPKGLILGPLDRLIFGRWLPRADQPVHLIGASIGAWRMATACLPDCISGFERLERDYIAQDYELPPGSDRPTATQVSETFGANLAQFFGGHLAQVLHHPRYRLHVLTSRGRHLLRREHRLLTPLGYAGAFLANAVHRRALGAWLERVVFSTPMPMSPIPAPVPLPFAPDGLRTRQRPLTEANFMAALQASCSIPFLLKAVPDVAGAPRGAYWDGGITDYHLHLPYRLPASSPIVLYPHFQRAVVPGWLDKVWKRRHRPTPALDGTLVLAPDPRWVAALPGGKLPDRSDFTRYGTDLAARMAAWGTVVAMARQLADEFEAWLERPDPGRIEPL